MSQPNSHNSNKKELILKLKALAERGEGGERDNAEVLLKRLMDKYDIAETDLDADAKEYYEFEIDEWTKQLLIQVASTVIGSDFHIYKQKDKEDTSVVLHLTTSQYLELQAKYDFYLQAFKQEFDIFRRAFVASNSLYDSNSAEIADNEFTQEDLKVMKLACSIEKRIFDKQIK